VTLVSLDLPDQLDHLVKMVQKVNVVSQEKLDFQ
jgi:hypothetical protein